MDSTSIVEFRETIIRPALLTIGLWSEAAEELILGTAFQESGLMHTHQIGGPALGYLEMEPATHDDCWKNFLFYRRLLANKVGTLSQPQWLWVMGPKTPPDSAQLETNHKYLRAPMQTPDKGDVVGMAQMWKAVYNPGGKGTVEEFCKNWSARMET
jgi:hypothetical protein